MLYLKSNKLIVILFLKTDRLSYCRVVDYSSYLNFKPVFYQQDKKLHFGNSTFLKVTFLQSKVIKLY